MYRIRWIFESIKWAIQDMFGCSPKRWIRSDYGDWNDPSCWKPFGVPGEKDDVVIRVGKGKTVVLRTQAGDICNDLLINGQGTIEINSPDITGVFCQNLTMA